MPVPLPKCFTSARQKYPAQEEDRVPRLPTCSLYAQWPRHSRARSWVMYVCSYLPSSPHAPSAVAPP
eukprot:3357085-Prymnesium_polylepis.1